MALDWSHCPAVESVPGRLNGAWVFKDTRMPVSAVFENLEDGAAIEEIMEWFHLTREQIVEVIEFAPEVSMLRFLSGQLPNQQTLILSDHSSPTPLRHFLKEHAVTETRERAWDQLEGGPSSRQNPSIGFNMLWEFCSGTPPLYYLHMRRRHGPGEKRQVVERMWKCRICEDDR